MRHAGSLGAREVDDDDVREVVARREVAQVVAHSLDGLEVRRDDPGTVGLDARAGAAGNARSNLAINGLKGVRQALCEAMNPAGGQDLSGG